MIPEILRPSLLVILGKMKTIDTIVILALCHIFLIACSNGTNEEAVQTNSIQREEANTPKVHYSKSIDYVRYQKIANSIKAEYPLLSGATFTAKFDYVNIGKKNPNIGYSIRIPNEKFQHFEGKYSESKELLFVDKIKNQFKSYKISGYSNSDIYTVININPSLNIYFLNPLHPRFEPQTKNYDKIIKSGGQDYRGDFVYKLADGIYLKTERR